MAFFNGLLKTHFQKKIHDLESLTKVCQFLDDTLTDKAIIRCKDMSIEINGSSNRPPVAASEGSQAGAVSRGGAGGPGRPSAPSPSAADTFSLTNRAAQLQQLEAQIANLPVVDTQRVSEVQHALSTGTLEVDPARVADKLLRFEAGLDPQQ